MQEVVVFLPSRCTFVTPGQDGRAINKIEKCFSFYNRSYSRWRAVEADGRWRLTGPAGVARIREGLLQGQYR